MAIFIMRAIVHSLPGTCGRAASDRSAFRDRSCAAERRSRGRWRLPRPSASDTRCATPPSLRNTASVPSRSRQGNRGSADRAYRSSIVPPVSERHSVTKPKGASMQVRAAVAHKAGMPLTIETVELDGPRHGEVLVELMATGICHTDDYTLSGADPEGLFPAILGHEGAGIVVETGSGVSSLKKGDHVIPLYTPECRECEYCLSRKTNLCQKIRVTQGQGLMPDGTSRFSLKGERVLHYMGTSTFANYTVVPEIALAKIREDAPFDKVCYIGCGVTTAICAVTPTAKVEPR